jgi:hypothetical protein
MGQIRKRGNLWSIRYYVGGRRIEESTGTRNRADAARLLKLREAAAVTGSEDERRVVVEDRIQRFWAARASESEDIPTFVYIAQCGEAVKIGVAVDVGKRIRGLQTAAADPIRVLRAIRHSFRRVARSNEAGLHRRFAKSRVRGEWFTATAELLVAIATMKVE